MISWRKGSRGRLPSPVNTIAITRSYVGWWVVRPDFQRQRPPPNHHHSSPSPWQHHRQPISTAKEKENSAAAILRVGKNGFWMPTERSSRGWVCEMGSSCIVVVGWYYHMIECINCYCCCCYESLSPLISHCSHIYYITAMYLIRLLLHHHAIIILQ